MYQDPTAAKLWEKAGNGAAPRLYQDSGYLADVASGAIDAMLYDCPLARYELAHDPAGPGLEISNDHLGLGTYSIAVSAKVPGLREDVDAALGDLGTSGVFPQLTQRWLATGPPTAYQDPTGNAVVVAPGETIDAVAARAGVKVSDLTAWNADILGSGAPSVYAGMLLRVR
jgi:hypothetical protein